MSILFEYIKVLNEFNIPINYYTHNKYKLSSFYLVLQKVIHCLNAHCLGKFQKFHFLYLPFANCQISLLGIHCVLP